MMLMAGGIGGVERVGGAVKLKEKVFQTPKLGGSKALQKWGGARPGGGGKRSRAKKQGGGDTRRHECAERKKRVSEGV